MSLWKRLFGRRPALVRMDQQALRRQEILLERKCQRLSGQLQKVEVEQRKIFDDGAAESSASQRLALARRYETLAQQQKLLGRELNIRSKELLTVCRVKLLKENRSQRLDASGYLNLPAKDLATIAMWMDNDSINQREYGQRLDTLLERGAESDQAALDESALGGTAQDVMNLWRQLDRGQLQPAEARRRLVPPAQQQ